MQLNLHELINQPGYGKANEAVRKAGYWSPFADDTERMDWLEAKCVIVLGNDGSEIFSLSNYDWETWLRDAIDDAAITEMKEEPQS